MRIHTLKIVEELENQVYDYKANLFPVFRFLSIQTEIESEKWQKVLSLLGEIKSTLK